MQLDWQRPRVHRIHQNLSQIEEGVVRIQLRTEGAGIIREGFVLYLSALLCALNPPAALIEFVDREELADAARGTDPINDIAQNRGSGRDAFQTGNCKSCSAAPGGISIVTRRRCRAGFAREIV